MIRPLILAALGLALLGVAPSPKQSGQPEQRNSASEAENGATPARNDSLEIAREVEPVETVQPSEVSQYCERGEDNRKSDLCAQWKAADSAYNAAKWAKLSLAVGVIGTLGLFATLYWTRQAVHVAMEATKDADTALAIAERNAKAAADQAEVARDTASKQLRAYIGVLKATAYFIGSARPRVIIEIKNYGQTPAFNVTSHTGLYIDTHQTGFPGKGDNGSTVIFAHEFGIVEPGQERLIWVNIPEDWIAENIAALREGSVRLFSETSIGYSDVGGVSRHRGFCCYLPRLLHSADRRDYGAMPMTVTASGNVDSSVGQWAEVHHLPPLEEGETDQVRQ